MMQGINHRVSCPTRTGTLPHETRTFDWLPLSGKHVTILRCAWCDRSAILNTEQEPSHEQHR